jgi:hypothetical protein
MAPKESVQSNIGTCQAVAAQCFYLRQVSTYVMEDSEKAV